MTTYVRVGLTVALACALSVAMTASAWAQDEPTGTLTNPVIEDSSGNPISGDVGLEADSASSILTTVNPDQGPFDCVVHIEATVDSAGDAVLNVVDIGPGTDPECGTGVQAPPFSLPWPGHVCLEESAAGDFTAWFALNIVELATPLQSYGSNNPNPGNENLWVRLTPTEPSLPVGPVAGAHVNDTIPGFTSGSGTITGEYDVTPDIPLFADNAGGTCSLTS